MSVEINVANYDGDFRELISRYSGDFEKVTSPVTVVDKQGLFVRRDGRYYLLMISFRDPSIPGYYEHNVMISVNGPDDGTVREIMKDFVETIGIETRRAPPELEKILKPGLSALSKILDRG